MRAGADEDRLAADRDEQPGEPRRAAREHRHDDVAHAPDALAGRVVDRQAAQLRREHPHGRITALSSPSRGARPAPRRSGSTTSASANSCVSTRAMDDAARSSRRERGAHVARAVMEGAAQRERLVVQPVAVDGHHGLARQARRTARRVPPGAARPDRAAPRPPACRPPRSRSRSCAARPRRGRAARGSRRAPRRRARAAGRAARGRGSRCAGRGGRRRRRRRGRRRPAARSRRRPRARRPRARDAGSRARCEPARAAAARRRR